MRGNGWVGGLIRYIRRKDGNNAANTPQRVAKDEDPTAEFRTFVCPQRRKGSAQAEWTRNRAKGIIAADIKCFSRLG